MTNKWLIDRANTGPFKTLYQTWEQQKGAALRLAEARVAEDQQRISQLEEVIIAQAQPFEKDKVYNAGDIVDVGGNLFEALVDGADITRTDLFA